MKNTESNSQQSVFCRKCGQKLPYDSLFCIRCGADISFVDTPGNADAKQAVSVQNTYSENSTPKAKIKLGSIIILLLIVALLSCAAFFVLPKSTPTTVEKQNVNMTAQPAPALIDVEKQNINMINGCPEFYNVQFDMTAQQASALIETEHETFIGYEIASDSKDSFISLADDAQFDLYDLPVFDIRCSFDGLSLDAVFITFSKENSTLEEIVDLYTRIYGEPTFSDASSATWLGEQTTIDIFDMQLFYNDSYEIVVDYYKTPNRQYKALTFDGPEHDPCNLLTAPVFSRTPDYYINGLTLDKDYTVDNYGYFTEYTLYPKFTFMGIEEGMTGISFDVDASETNISVYRYLFLLEKATAADYIRYIAQVLEEEYGSFSSCTYTSMQYDALGIIDLSFDEYISRIADGTEGIYNAQLISGISRITLSVTVDPREQYCLGSVATAE